MLIGMSDVTQILAQIEEGDPSAADQLLPLVYEELRKLAAARLAQEKPGQTLQATALVHDACPPFWERLLRAAAECACSRAPARVPTVIPLQQCLRQLHVVEHVAKTFIEQVQAIGAGQLVFIPIIEHHHERVDGGDAIVIQVIRVPGCQYS